MTDFRMVGKVTSHEPGKWENQYDVYLDTPDGERKVAAYSNKKDGSISAVWPMILDSYKNGTVLAWIGNAREVENKHRPGTTTYHTITYGFQPRDGELNGEKLSAPVWNKPETPEPMDWGKPRGEWNEPEKAEVVHESRLDNLKKIEAPPTWTSNTQEDRSELEAEWAVGVLYDHYDSRIDHLVDAAIALIVTKRRVATEVRK